MVHLGVAILFIVIRVYHILEFLNNGLLLTSLTLMIILLTIFYWFWSFYMPLKHRMFSLKKSGLLLFLDIIRDTLRSCILFIGLWNSLLFDWSLSWRFVIRVYIFFISNFIIIILEYLIEGNFPFALCIGNQYAVHK